MPTRRAWQLAAIHVACPALHGRPGQHVFAGGLLHETAGCNDGHVIGKGLAQAADAAEMINVAVGDQHRRDRPWLQVLHGEGPGGLGGLRIGQGIDHNPTLLAANQRHIGEVEAPQLIDAGNDLEQGRDAMHVGLAPQTGMHAVRSGAVDEVIGRDVPDPPAVFPRDDQVIRASDQPATGGVHAIQIRLRHRCGHCLIGLNSGRRRR